MKHTFTRALLISLGAFTIFTATAQRGMTVDDLATWKRITDQTIANDGKYIGCKVSPLSGDATIRIFQQNGQEVGLYTPADKFEFSFSSQYVIITRTPGKALTDSLKLAKTKKEKMPANSLVIRRLSGGEEVIDSLKAYKLSESGDWLAYQRESKDSTLFVRSLDGVHVFKYPSPKSYQFAKKSNRMYCVSKGDTIDFKAGLYLLDPEKGSSALVKEGKGEFKQPSFNKEGNLLAFLYCEEKDSVYKALDLWLTENGKDAQSVATRNHEALPTGWVISENGTILFSENGKRLFFGTAPEPRQKDTTQLDEYRPNVQVWTWNEHTQRTVQTHNKAKDLKKTYQAVYNISNQKLIQLADKELPQVILGDEGNSEIALLETDLPYPTSSMWEGVSRKDYYGISLETGERRLLKQNITSSLKLSPKGEYAWWYAKSDSSWYSISVADGKEYRLTNPQTFPVWDEDNDVPDYPDSYGAAGWTTDDQYFLLYDRYDLWLADPKGTQPLVNLTRNGKSEKITYRLIQLDKEEKAFDRKKTYLATGFNRKTKAYGYYELKLGSPTNPKSLFTGDFMVRMPIKAKNANTIIYSIESFERYPELYVSDLSFKKQTQLTQEGEQQKEFLWGTAELTSWVSLDGVPLEGIIYKPGNFDPKKKYPMIVNFYELASNELFQYNMPQPGRSTIDYHMYTSNGYIVFVPDVRYKTGYPGESCFNCVMPGISKLISEGYVDEKAIGAQGHSWGGYQVAYLATRTNLFAAIESGAPVVNMVSAYGGIRWNSGLNRSFQYEMSQSRIGETLWQAPHKYIENSPVFAMDKVQTPILIMHNDNDGHVPWYQGIEYFIALKRLQKPVWMLNYPGEIHWPERMANRIDFQKRMLQFFNHYLKKESMPKWMEEGVQAVDQDFELGY